MAEDDPVVQWLLQSDPAIRWQVLRDLVHASETEVATERARVEHEGWGARLLALRAPDGLWANGAYIPGTAAFAAATARALAAGEPPPPFPSPDAEPAEAPTDGSSAEPGQPWTATYPVLLDLCHLGIPPDSPVMQETAHLVARNCRWEYDGLPFFAGEVDGLLEFERATGGSTAVREARRGGEEYTGEVADAAYLDFAFPYYWHYDVLRALDYFRQARAEPDPRTAAAVEVVRSKHQPDGRWLLDRIHPGRVHFAIEGDVGQPSGWNTLRALRVLDWWKG
jgi:hypothetical protein